MSIETGDTSNQDRARPEEPAIHRAARLGRTDELAALVDAGASIDERADLEFDHGPHLRQLTPLMFAARSVDGASVETLRWLVEHGADWRAVSEGRDSAAWYAAGGGAIWEPRSRDSVEDHAERLRYLLDLGLDPHECNFIGQSLMVEACTVGDPERVRLLLEREVSFDPIIPDGCAASRLTTKLHTTYLEPMDAGGAASSRIPLFCAAGSGSAETVRLLLEAGADPRTLDDSGGTALMQAGSVDAARTLLKAGVDLHATDRHGSDAFDQAFHASTEGDSSPHEAFEIGRFLIERGVDIERRDHFDKTRLASAAFRHQADVVGFLISVGADVRARDREGGTALHSICWQGEYSDNDLNAACERIIRSLAAAGSEIDARNAAGSTPMHVAVAGDWGNATAVETLLALGAHPDLANDRGETPLMLAADRPELACMELLLRAGADPMRKNAQGQSSLAIAEQKVRYWREVVARGGDRGSGTRGDQSNELAAGDEEARRREEGTEPLSPDHSKLQRSALQDHERSLAALRRAASSSPPER
ncbi:MAG: ankyrin repeat domain-containing protein [Planctomycetota bacterium]